MIPHSKPWISQSDRDAVLSVLSSGNIANGKLVKKFERNIEIFTGSYMSIALSSGTSAIVLALNILAIGSGDHVVLPTYVCRNVLDAVISTGAKPILCDVNEEGVIDVHTVSSKITSKTKAIIAVHIFGRYCDIEPLKQFGVYLIEDACQAFGVQKNGALAGVSGDIGIFSFHATKCFTTGEGGMLITSSESMVGKIRSYLGGDRSRLMLSSSRFSDMQAALGISQFARLSQFTSRRQYIRDEYMKVINDFSIKGAERNFSNVPFRFCILTEKPYETLKDSFSQLHITIRRGVDELLHRMMSLDDAHYPVATNLFNKNISIPIYPSLSESEVITVKESLRILIHEN